MNEYQMARYIFELNRVDLIGLSGSELLKDEISKSISLRNIDLIYISKSMNDNYIKPDFWEIVKNEIKKL